MKNPSFRRGGSQKTDIEGGIAKKKGLRGAWAVCRFRGGLSKKEGGGVFEGRGVDTPMHTMIFFSVLGGWL